MGNEVGLAGVEDPPVVDDVGGPTDRGGTLDVEPERVVSELLPHLLSNSHGHQCDRQLAPRFGRHRDPRAGRLFSAWRTNLRGGYRWRDREKKCGGDSAKRHRELER
jgi:hypothetical protein